MWSLLLVSHAFAGRYDGRESDIVASGHVDAPLDAVRAAVSDLGVWGEVFPSSCAEDYTLGAPTAGPGAQASLRYVVGAWNRILVLRVDAVRDTSVDHVHDGPKGFTTRYELVADDAGTQVTAHTYIAAPPWPFKGYYFKRVQPGFQACLEQAITALDARLGG